jgi:hypothetical protein
MPKAFLLILPLLALALALAPRFVVSMSVACAALSAIAFSGAWLMDRYASLPGQQPA